MTTTTTSTSTTAVVGTTTPWLGTVEPDYTPPDGRRVAVLGDSLTVSSYEELRAALPDHSMRIAALHGEGLSSGPFSKQFGQTIMLDEAAAIGQEDPEVVVLALGTNDAWQPSLTVEAATAAIDQMASDLSDTCLVVVTLVDSAGYDYDSDEARAINDALRGVADRVADWGAAADEPGLLASDGIHLTEAGRTARAGLIAEEVRACA